MKLKLFNVGNGQNAPTAEDAIELFGYTRKEVEEHLEKNNSFNIVSYNVHYKITNYETPLTDKEIRHLWRNLEDATMIETTDGELVLCSRYFIWEVGTTQSDIWSWFGKNYSKGLNRLIYGF